MKTQEQKEEKAKALGFNSAQEADEHVAWLKQNAGPEYLEWLKSINDRRAKWEAA